MIKQRKLKEEVVNCIMLSFIDLLKVKKFDNISIVEIIKHAGVSRNSFYRNFMDKEDILTRYIERETVNFVSQSQNIDLTAPWDVYVEKVLLHMYEYKEVTSILYKNNRLYIISNIFDKVVQQKVPSLDKTHAYFLSGGMFNIFYHWAADDYKQNPKEIAKNFSSSVLGI